MSEGTPQGRRSRTFPDSAPPSPALRGAHHFVAVQLRVAARGDQVPRLVKTALLVRAEEESLALHHRGPELRVDLRSVVPKEV